MGFWSSLRERVKNKRAEKKHMKEHKYDLTFSKNLKKLSKKYKKLDSEFFADLEDILVQTDMGMKMVIEISDSLQKRVKPKHTFTDIKEMLIEELYDRYDSKKYSIDLNYKPGRLNIFMMVGVNGTGKTTSLAKLANYYAKQNLKVLIAAADTFRAGAVEQLQEWVNTRLTGVDLVRGEKQNQDPASVVFDGVKKAQEGNYDVLLIDTAGRLQNKQNLMRELEKMTNIVQRTVKDAPHERLLVIDATTGQNGVIQAKEFAAVTDVTGIVLTKMDGTSKGGIALAIKDSLNIPVKMIGVGEQMDDIEKFDLDEFVYRLASDFMEESEEDDE
jgi:fused signal recognition particle receptor